MSTLDFSWEEVEAQDDFFTAEEVETDNPPASQEEENEEFFEEGGEEDESPDLFGEETVEQVPDEITPSAVQYLIDKGLIDVDEDELEGLDDEEIALKFEEAIDGRVADKLISLPEDAQALIKYCLNGGSVASFYEYMSKAGATSGLQEDMDLEDEDVQETIMRTLLAAEDNDQDYIESQIEFLKDSGRLYQMAEKKYNKWLKNVQKEKENLSKKQRKQTEETRRQEAEQRREIAQTLIKSDNIAGLSFSAEDKKELPDFMNKKTVKLNNGSTISEMQRILFYELPKKKEAMLQLAILLRNRKEDGTFDFSAVERQTVTKYTKGIKEEVRRNKKAVPGTVEKSIGLTKNLADYFK